MPTFLPGSFIIERGSCGDYLALEHFHYLPKRPSSWALVLRIVYREREIENNARVIAVGVLSYPVLSCRLRERVLGLTQLDRQSQGAFANRHIRIISRVIVHPQFRALGLASLLVRQLIDSCPTRYVEALALMGRAHPFFKSAGMHEIQPPTPNGPVYYLIDKKGGQDPLLDALSV